MSKVLKMNINKRQELGSAFDQKLLNRQAMPNDVYGEDESPRPSKSEIERRLAGWNFLNPDRAIEDRIR